MSGTNQTLAKEDGYRLESCYLENTVSVYLPYVAKAADPHLCFPICKIMFFHDAADITMHLLVLPVLHILMCDDMQLCHHYPIPD